MGTELAISATNELVYSINLHLIEWKWFVKE